MEAEWNWKWYTLFVLIISETRRRQVAVTGGVLVRLAVVFFWSHSLMNRKRGIELRV